MGPKIMETNKAKHRNSETCSWIYGLLLDSSKQYVSKYFLKDIAVVCIVTVTIVFKGIDLA